MLIIFQSCICPVEKLAQMRMEPFSFQTTTIGATNDKYASGWETPFSFNRVKSLFMVSIEVKEQHALS